MYGFNDEDGRKGLWKNLMEIARKIQCLPWIVAGDFNDVLEQNERIGKRVNRRLSEDFKNCVGHCGLTDLKFSMNYYTWNNKRELEERICCKLDRALVNQQWMEDFSNSEAIFLPEGQFDHSPILISVFIKMRQGRRGHFDTTKCGSLHQDFRI